jgi:hypothetical protein
MMQLNEFKTLADFYNEEIFKDNGVLYFVALTDDPDIGNIFILRSESGGIFLEQYHNADLQKPFVDYANKKINPTRRKKVE